MIKSKVRSVFIFALFLLLGTSTAVLLYFFQVFYQSDTFLPGVTIAGIPVAGYNTIQASCAVQKLINTTNANEIAFFKGNYIYKTTLNHLTQPIEVQELVKQIWIQERQRDWKKKLANLDGSQEIAYHVNIRYDLAAQNQMVEEWNKYLKVERKNARLEMDSAQGLFVVPGQMGKIIDKAATFEQLPRRWEDIDQELNIPIVVKDENPDLDEKALSNMAPLSEFFTWFKTSDVNRAFNLSKATTAINGSVVLPGQVFSFNQTVGKRIVENGYRDAMIIVGGKFQPGPGGGVCQVSSTLYNACLLAGLKIVERHNHSLAVAYVPLGRDATVVYGSQDFQFQNNSDHPVYIRAGILAGKLSMDIYGYPPYLQKIEITNVVNQVINFQTVRVIDMNLKPGQVRVENNGLPGYVVTTFRIFYDENGNAVKKEQLARDTYSKMDKIVYVGYREVPASQPPQENNPLNPGGDSQPPSSVPDTINNNPPIAD